MLRRRNPPGNRELIVGVIIRSALPREPHSPDRLGLFIYPLKSGTWQAALRGLNNPIRTGAPPRAESLPLTTMGRLWQSVKFQLPRLPPRSRRSHAEQKVRRRWNKLPAPAIADGNAHPPKRARSRGLTQSPSRSPRSARLARPIRAATGTFESPTTRPRRSP